jgi:hypothetical protein
VGEKRKNTHFSKKKTDKELSSLKTKEFSVQAKTLKIKEVFD